MSDDDRNQEYDQLPRTETDLQVDPFLRTRRGGSLTVWVWAASLFIVAVLVATFYSLNS